MIFSHLLANPTTSPPSMGIRCLPMLAFWEHLALQTKPIWIDMPCLFICLRSIILLVTSLFQWNNPYFNEIIFHDNYHIYHRGYSCASNPTLALETWSVAGGLRARRNIVTILKTIDRSGIHGRPVIDSLSFSCIPSFLWHAERPNTNLRGKKKATNMPRPSSPRRTGQK